LLQAITHFGYKSGYTIDKFDNVRFIIGKNGTPIVTEDAAAWFECEVVSQVDVGSHILFIGKVSDCELLDESNPPMTYAWYREFRKGASPKNAPTYIDPSLIASTKANPENAGKRYRCLACSYIYDPAQGDPDSGIAPGTPFEEIPEDWMCPVCGATKDMFEEIF
jgi:rubredoxin